ncbi:MAG: A/G-specific adenine glycosylase, partial [Kangiellaceae bacterium]|nr:A/G-specific adenine glycosylase [Kangiellaceae bacterium]
MNSNDFSQAVLEFYNAHGRKDLPWQIEKTHYRVWVSEVMLQQTQVATVIPYYQKFMTSFPSVKQLAAATVDDVLAHWSGLGYYSRARNLHKCAQTIMSDYGGIWPNNVDELEALPGIGRSTAGAIHSLATGQPATILDGNVKRVLCRVFGVEGWPGQTKVHKQLWQIADEMTPQSRVDEYNQAMMDLGATLCTRRNPGCTRCPLVDNCHAYATGSQHQLPNSKPKKIKPVKASHFLILRHGNQV